MPDKKGRMTPKERVLMDVFVATGSVKQAGREAGYAHVTAAHKALARPAVAAEVARLQLERIQNELLPIAVDVHVQLLTGANVPAGAKVQAVKLAYDRAFGDGAARPGKELHEMTGDELAAEIEKLKRRKATIEARDVSAEPAPADDAFA